MSDNRSEKISEEIEELRLAREGWGSGAYHAPFFIFVPGYIREAAIELVCTELDKSIRAAEIELRRAEVKCEFWLLHE